MAKRKTASKPAPKATDDLDFEEALAEVEQIVDSLEGGELGLTESLQHYETGIRRLKECHRILAAAEQQVNVLSGFDAEGNPVSGPIDQLETRSGAGRRSKKAASTGSLPSDGSAGSSGSLDRDTDGGSSVDDSAELF